MPYVDANEVDVSILDGAVVLESHVPIPTGSCKPVSKEDVEQPEEEYATEDEDEDQVLKQAPWLDREAPCPELPVANASWRRPRKRV